MADITGDFNINMPSGTSRKSDGDDLMRQHWRSLGSTWSTEHYFIDSAISAGIHKKGSARVYVQTTAPASSLDRDGRIWLDSATSRSFILRDSARTTPISGSQQESPLLISRQFDRSSLNTTRLVTVSLTTSVELGMAGGGAKTWDMIFDEIPNCIATIERNNATDFVGVMIKKISTNSATFVTFDGGLAFTSKCTLHALLTGWVSNFS